MTSEAECVLPSRMHSLPRAAAFVEEFCGRHGVGTEDTLRLTLIVEELFTNTVEHGHGGDCDAPVRLALSAGPAELTLWYEDDAPAFDPRAGAERAADGLDTPAAGHRVGGLGLVLVVRMAASVDYAREGGRNRLRVALSRQA
jgi:anti-sigma regulatory factor (Ser/Thr protein kinase)